MGNAALFDFIKSCGGRIDLKFSGAALLGLLYSPKWKRSFFSKGKVSFSMAGSLLRAVQESFSVKEIYRWKEDRFVFFMKKLKGLGYLPFQEKMKQKWSEKLKMTFLNPIPTRGGGGTLCPPGTLPQISQERLELRT